MPEKKIIGKTIIPVDSRYRFAYIEHIETRISEAAMLFKKPHGATPEPDQAKILAFQERRAAKCKLERTQPAVLCDAELPSSWQPLSNNERYQMWVAKKGEAA